VIALVLIRVGDKRFLGRQTAFDWVLGIIFGAVLSRAINGSAPFFPTLGAAAVLLALHWLFAAIAFRSHGFSRAIKGRPSVLVRAGEVQWNEMRRNHVTEGDLLEDLRYEAHIDTVGRVETATLECNGRMSVIPRRVAPLRATRREFMRIGRMKATPGPVLGIVALAFGVAATAAEPAFRLDLAGEDEPGIRLVVRGVVHGPNGAPIAGASLRVFHTDAHGWYTPTKVMDEPHARLMGRVTTDTEGRFEIHTIRPGAYPVSDQTPEDRRIPEHIHFEISASGFAFQRFQLVFENDPRMTPYWHEWAREGHHPVVPVVEQPDGSQTCSLDIKLER
jgi:protocatechuate 3,4-dioxygenase beta subunit